MSALSRNTDTVAKLEGGIRELINEPWKHKSLQEKPRQFIKACSALDIIGDTAIAIDTFVDNPDVRSLGERYIRIYGLLQIFQVQQDAAKYLADALEIKLTRNKKLEGIKALRHRATGHPVERRSNNVRMSTFIGRASLTSTGFDLMTVGSDGNFHVESVNLMEIVKKQEKGICEQLSHIYQQLRKEVQEHKMIHRAEKLVDILHPSIPYMLGKVYEALHRQDMLPDAEKNLEIVQSMFGELRDTISRRNLYDNDQIHRWFDDVMYALDVLISDINDNTWEKLKEYDVVIYTHYIEHKHNELRKLAADIDEYYQKDT